MMWSVESCTIFSVALMVTFTLTLSQGQKCPSNASPHPQGMCGEQLTTAHANLCFLVRRAFPEYFPSHKRSFTPSYMQPEALHSRARQPRARRDLSSLERIYNIPMSVWASVHLTDDNWRSFVYKRGVSNVLKRDTTGEFKLSLENLKELPFLADGPTKRLIRMFSNRSTRSVQKRSRGLACECCINVCSPRHLATYC